MPETFDRYEVIDPVAGCFACENPAGVPIPLDEFPAGGDIGLCSRHWNWWLTRFAYVMNPTPEPPCAAHLLASEIERERAVMSKRAADVEVRGE